MRTKSTVSILFWISIAATQAIPAAAQPRPQGAAFGQFQGRVVVEWLDDAGDSRRMRLLEPFAYRDATGKVWKVPKGWTIDGASIPPMLWSMVGSPYTGPYRRASVIHDYYCDTKKESWKAVDRMFYDAMRAGGVGELQAKIMYKAVYQFGPRWTILTGPGLENGGAQVVSYTAHYASDQSPDLDQWIRSANPGLEQIDEAVDKLEVPKGH
ncbi:MAG TPA: DUF1353 domain-containing protein [Allosphingosinicella sp.]|jgi:hypothetical protein